MFSSESKVNKIPLGIIFSIKGFELNSSERSFFSNTNPFGFILFSRNFKNIKQLKDLINELRQITLNKNIYIFVDQEGGKVQRFSNYEFTKLPSQNFFEREYLKNSSFAKKLVYYNARIMGRELKKVGIDVNCAPVLDLKYSYTHEIIGNRSFSKSPKIVADLGKFFCKGLKDSGILPVIKHFPGHGRSTFDSHLTLPKISTSVKILQENDLYPFKMLKKEQFVMIAHIVYTEFDNVVATYSHKIIKDLLIKTMKFKGLILSDDLSMKALKGRMIDRVKKSYEAGCDILLYCSGKLKDMENIYPKSKSISCNKFKLFEKNLSKLRTKPFTHDIIKEEILYKNVSKK